VKRPHRDRRRRECHVESLGARKIPILDFLFPLTGKKRMVGIRARLAQRQAPGRLRY